MSKCRVSNTPKRILCNKQSQARQLFLQCFGCSLILLVQPRRFGIQGTHSGTRRANSLRVRYKRRIVLTAHLQLQVSLRGRLHVPELLRADPGTLSIRQGHLLVSHRQFDQNLISETLYLKQPLTRMRHQFSELSKFDGILGLLIF
jgi:hypothetical protein